MKPLKLLFIFCIVCVGLLFTFKNKSVVSYEVTPGRFGDNLLTYLHAKWFSYEKQIPLIYTPFPYSSLLCLDEKEVYYKDKKTRKKLGLKPFFKTKVKKWSRFSKIPYLSFNYKCRYFPESLWERQHLNYFSFPVNWKDETFRKEIKQLIQPKHPVSLTIPPPHSVNIAIHVREGGGFDTQAARMIMPLKLPPLDFYIEGLKYVVSLFPGKNFYCYVFTDALEPEQIVKKIKEDISSDIHIEYGYRKENNFHEANVLEDFFSFFHFDVLIHPQSNYSLIPSLLHDYAITYSPLDCKIENETVQITEVEIQTNKELCEKLHSL